MPTTTQPGLRGSGLGILLLTLGLLAGCVPRADPGPTRIELDPPREERGAVVLTPLRGDPAAVEIRVGGVAAEVVRGADARTIGFVVPDAAPPGPQRVRVTTSGRSFEGRLVVLDLDRVVADRVVVGFREGSDPAAIQARLDELATGEVSYRLVRARGDDALRPLPGEVGPCAGDLAVIEVEGQTLGQALMELRGVGDVVFGPDPEGIADGDTVDPLGAVRARPLARLPNNGEGVTIALLDTGVSPHVLLQDRLLRAEGLDAVEPGTPPDDVFDDPNLSPLVQNEGHGTAAAVLAAGDGLGIAQGARVLPVRVCDGRRCLASDVVVGLCHAIDHARRNDGLERMVFNLSFGGPTPAPVVEALLRFAVEGGASVVASAGNEGPDAPVHFPAAHRIPGLIAVGALAQCSGFEEAIFDPDRSRFVLGDTFVSGGRTFRVQPAISAAREASVSGSVIVGTRVQAGGSGRELLVRDALLNVAFDRAVPGLSLRFADLAGSINLVVNGVLITLADPADLSGTLGGAELAFGRDPAGGSGILRLTGRITSLGIGGQAVAVDALCLDPAGPGDWFPADFASWAPTDDPYVDLAAPGDYLTSGAPDENDPAQLSARILTGFRGSSFAAPLVTGAAAILKSATPTLPPAEVERCLVETATPLSAPNPRAAGAGMLDVAAAVQACAP